MRARAKAFQRILELEEVHGYGDTVVAGGLDLFLSRWSGESGGREKSDVLFSTLEKKRLLAVPYSKLSQRRRKTWVSIAKDCVSAIVGTEEWPKATTRKRKSTDVGADLRTSPVSPDDPVSTLNLVTPRVVSGLSRLEIDTIRDLLSWYPRRHNEVRRVAELRLDEEQTVLATLWDAREVRLGKKMKGTEAAVGDETGNIRVVWFNQPYLAKSLKRQARYVLSGRVTMRGRSRVLESPQHELVRVDDDLTKLAQSGRLFPVYPLTEGITQRTMRRVVREALERGSESVAEMLPQKLRRENEFLPIYEAVWHAHYPEGWEGKELARRRLAFEEMFILQLAVLHRRKRLESGLQATSLTPVAGVLERFTASLPFDFTQAQSRVLEEILSDLEAWKPMSRLLQGEVGSGKTVVALAALLVTATCGYQGAIMAPTEVLAEQHFITVARLLAGLAQPLKEDYLLSVTLDPYPQPITIALLLGSMTASSKRKVRTLLAEGSVDIVIGTHAIIQEKVAIPRLALAVVDEQHRFGVEQRSALRKRGENTHLLAMTATPIPRTLSLTLYGDLDLSTINELPPGRQIVRTKRVGPERRGAIYQFLRKQVAEGRQVFIIYPLIDESEAINARAAVKEWSRLSTEVFTDLRVGLLHGRMHLKEKQEVMERFREGGLDILVSTPVIEVGIDVPNASVMLVEGADRFGLAQLHQFRGRVGRGAHESYCVLVADAPSEDAIARLEAMERLVDGFQLAEVDLELRGPGEFFGTRQSGLPDLRMARLTDHDLLLKARAEAVALLEHDPELLSPENVLLSAALESLASPVTGEVS